MTHQVHPSHDPESLLANPRPGAAPPGHGGLPPGSDQRPGLVRVQRPGQYRRCRRYGTALLAGGLTLALLLTVSLAGCSEGTELSAPCAIIVDGSGSATQFDASARISKTTVRFLEDQHCARVVFVPLNGRSEGSLCFQQPLEMDDGVSDPKEIAPARRVVARQRALALLECARKESDGSDVIGAFRRAVRYRPTGTGTYAWLVVSDMVHTDSSVNLSKADLRTPAKRKKIIDAMQAVIPNMTGCVIFPTDSNKGVREKSRSVDILEFWRELLASRAAGNPVLNEGSYGS